ncbi:MAG: hypothetical protein L6R35_002313 [Caloplaca aegaea]|nr:MAG: hypothetical protein L6R35_002313 [Caloplaca aegaea]
MAPSTASEPPDIPNPGPHPSYIQIAKPYIFDSKIQECLLVAGVTETRDDSIRLQAVTWMDSARRALHLGFIDAAAAALFTACKIEDTLKKSRDILCAAHNLKLSASEQLTPDDPIFENHAKVIIGVERLMLEASGFDFRNRYPQRLLLKIAKIYGGDKDTVARTAYNMSLDLYRTFAPLKQTTATMAIACVELAGRILDQPMTELEAGEDYDKWKTTRQEIMETLLDLLDLYTHHRASTLVGQDHALEKFISIRIALNQEASAQHLARFTQSERQEALTNGATSNGVKKGKDHKGLTSPRDIASPNDTKSPQPMGLTSVTGTPVQGKPGLKDGTVRFMLDPKRARDEKHAVAEFFTMDEEEYEVEVEANHDRRRDSAICMTLSPPAEEETSETDSQCMDLEPPWDDIIWERGVGGGGHVGQENLSKAGNPGGSGAVEAHPSISNWKTKNVPLADQGVAFQHALQEQENLPPKAVVVADGNSGVETWPSSTSSWKKTNAPLADQGTAFQNALEQSHMGGAAPLLSLRGLGEKKAPPSVVVVGGQGGGGGGGVAAAAADLQKQQHPTKTREQNAAAAAAKKKRRAKRERERKRQQKKADMGQTQT